MEVIRLTRLTRLILVDEDIAASANALSLKLGSGELQTTIEALSSNVSTVIESTVR